MQFTRPRGTRDFLADEMERRRIAESRMRRVFENFGYREIATPAFEHLELFAERSGEEIIKELYAFKDKGNRDIVLRPELTAPVMRFYVSDMQRLPKPLKLYYFGNCFRYEEPQSGRYREFWQFGCELIGTDKPEGEAEVIALAMEAVRAAGSKNLELCISHLGILRKLFDDAEISAEDQRNLMRLIDKMEKVGEEPIRIELEKYGKEFADKILELISLSGGIEVLEKAKEISGADEVIERLREISKFLEMYGIKCVFDFSVARGLDYYTGMVFEIYNDLLGAENQVCGGGTYALAELFGGQSVSSTGFAIGFDRVMVALEKEKALPELKKDLIFVIPVDERHRYKALEITARLRTAGVRSDVDLMCRGLKSLKHADAVGATRSIIVGGEIENGKVVVRDMKTGEQKQIDENKIVEFISGACGRQEEYA